MPERNRMFLSAVLWIRWWKTHVLVRKDKMIGYSFCCTDIWDYSAAARVKYGMIMFRV